MCPPRPAPLAEAVTAAAAQTRRNIDALAAGLDHRQPATVQPATDLLDSADTVARQQGADTRRLRAASHALRQIDRAVVDAAIDLGAGDIKLW